MCLQKFPPSLQILWNLPLDSLLSYLHVLAEISPQFADFLKSATGYLLSYLNVLAEIPPSLQILWNLPLDSLLSYLHVLAEIPPPQFADFLKSATGQFAKLPIYACTNSPPSLQILWNLPLDSLLSYLYVLAEIPPPSLQILWNLPLDSLLSYLYVLAEIPPPVCRFCEICHWTVC